MDRDKILRTIGRDPKAGEEQAREWVKSGDEILIGYAMSVFKDMGDEPDFQAAKSARKRCGPREPKARTYSLKAEGIPILRIATTR